MTRIKMRKVTMARNKRENEIRIRSVRTGVMSMRKDDENDEEEHDLENEAENK